MKIRNGFISNSSSSSFILSSNKSINPKVIINLNNYITEIKNEEELYRAFVYGYELSEWNKKLFKKYKICQKLLQTGKIVYLGVVSDDSDDPISEMLSRGFLKSKTNEYEIIEDVERLT
jgi:hypothetical protein